MRTTTSLLNRHIASVEQQSLHTEAAGTTSTNAYSTLSATFRYRFRTTVRIHSSSLGHVFPPLPFVFISASFTNVSLSPIFPSAPVTKPAFASVADVTLSLLNEPVQLAVGQGREVADGACDLTVRFDGARLAVYYVRH